MPRTNTHEDFLRQLKMEAGCLVWTGTLNKDGYGFFRKEWYPWATHRYSYTKYVGDIPEGLSILHSCDNRSCVLPAHLRVGTQADNVADMDARGRRVSGGRLNNKECGKGHLREEHSTKSNNQWVCRLCERMAYKKRVAKDLT